MIIKFESIVTRTTVSDKNYVMKNEDDMPIPMANIITLSNERKKRDFEKAQTRIEAVASTFDW